MPAPRSKPDISRLFFNTAMQTHPWKNLFGLEALVKKWSLELLIHTRTTVNKALKSL